MNECMTYNGSRFRIGGRTAAPALLFLVWMAASALTGLPVRAQTVEAFTNSSGAGRVLLMWSPDTVTANVRYNIYRKEASEPSWSGTPINSVPISPVTDCGRFRTVIPSASATWNMLSYALGDSTGGIPPVTPLGNVCSIVSFPKGSEKWRRVQIFAGYLPDVAQVMGQGFQDNAVSVGKTYTYRIIRIDGGSELPLLPESEVTITAGSPGAIPTPGDVAAVPSDSKVQVLWEIPGDSKFQSFDVRRATGPGGPWRKVNDVSFSSEIRSTINQDTVDPAQHGFTDYQRYDTNGAFATHDVPNPPGPDVSVNGPFDGTTYYYQVRHKDPMGNPGAWSATVSATPVDSTRPAVPYGLSVTAVEEMNGFQIRWNRVSLDIQGNAEAVRGYRVYRYENPEDPNVGATQVGGIVSQPGDTSITIEIFDTSPGLRSPCGDKSYFYRIETLDSTDNRSFRSVAVGDALKDTTRPDDVSGTETEGFNDYIQVRWDLNSDCDIDEYRIYRAYCNYGDWFPCLDREYEGSSLELYKRYVAMYGDQNYNPDGGPYTHYDPKKGGLGPKIPDCGGPFQLIGSITHEEAKSRKEATGKAWFNDETVPTESPICYAYLVKAVDRSQNESGFMPVPDPATEIILCERLRDKTPPGPAIVAGLLARDSTVIVEWIGPPVQDIAAYHVYRSEDENGPYVWAGGRTVVPPPATGVVLTAPFTAPGIVGCDSIPLVSRDWMSAGSIVDTVPPRDIYWYKIVGVDQQGNETPPDSAVGVSTFTFKSNRDPSPIINAVIPEEGPCALRIEWGPGFDPDSAIGFAVFRCRVPAGDYYQIGNIVKDNVYVDNSVARNVTYWYRIAMLRKDGSLTELSPPKHGLHP